MSQSHTEAKDNFSLEKSRCNLELCIVETISKKMYSGYNYSFIIVTVPHNKY